MVTIFANGRLWPSVGLNSSDGEALPGFYGDVLSLQVRMPRYERGACSPDPLSQRIYNELSKDSGHIPGDELIAASLTAVPHGPGSIPLERSVQSEGRPRYISSMENRRYAANAKTVLPSIEYKGEMYEPGECAWAI